MNSETGSPARRCAVYLRSATGSRPKQGADSLEAQREACLRFIQTQPGWEAIPITYMDVGFSGLDLDRPALQRLLFDVNAGAVDVVVVHDVTRLTRSSSDFRALMQRFNDGGVALVMVTPSPSTAINSAPVHLAPPWKPR
jgi:site-specific DNA recombinase